jgi:hypothetical protein
MTRAKGRFVPGQSGNPAGRPQGAKAVAEQVKALLSEQYGSSGKSGREVLVKCWLDDALDRTQPQAVRIHSGEMLAYYDSGKPALLYDDVIQSRHEVDLSQLSDSELMTLQGIQKKIKGI